MRISDWSSDVCSSDFLLRAAGHPARRQADRQRPSRHPHRQAAPALPGLHAVAAAVGMTQPRAPIPAPPLPAPPPPAPPPLLLPLDHPPAPYPEPTHSHTSATSATPRLHHHPPDGPRPHPPTTPPPNS